MASFLLKEFGADPKPPKVEDRKFFDKGKGKVLSAIRASRTCACVASHVLCQVAGFVAALCEGRGCIAVLPRLDALLHRGG